MSVRDIVLFPDPRLRQKAAVVRGFDDGLASLCADLLDTMRAAPGVGIAGPHIGAPWRVVVLELTPGVAQIYINPAIIWHSDETRRYHEGSVSMPGAVEMIERPACVRVTYQDVTGAERIEEVEGWLAACLQHEIDQLDGVFWLQRLSRLRREMVVKKWAKRRKG